MPAWVRAVSVMRHDYILVRWSCHMCKQWGGADLARVEAAKGLDFSLVNRRPKCHQPGCFGRVLLSYAPGPSTPFRPLLWDEEGKAPRAAPLLV